MDKFRPNENVIHPSVLLKRQAKGVKRFNTVLAVTITNRIGSMWSAYLFALLSLLSLPAILVLISPSLRHHLPKWLIASSLITLIAWISQNFLQLVLLPIIMVGQNVIQDHQNAKAESDHKTLTYLVNLQEEQMTELKSQAETLEVVKKAIIPKA
ncbi:MAG: hypothetical protein ACYCPS_01860 [Candidatus Saccharimonadales bacterium]